MISKFDKIAYEYFQEGNFDKDYWKIVFHLKDKEPEKLKDYEVQFINGYNETMTLIAEYSALKCLIANTPEEEVKKSKEEFLTHYIISEENRQKIRDSVDIGCPVCKAKLVFIKTMRAESLSEHCTSEHVSLKDMYGCPSVGCFANENGLLWIGDSGEGFYGGSFDIRNNDKVFSNRNSAPYRTFSRKLNAEQEKTSFKVKFLYFMVILKISSKADENGKKHWNKIFNIEVYTRKNLKDSSYSMYLSGIRMFIFSIKQYLNRWSRMNNFKDSLRREDDRWWAKLSLSFAKIIWKKDYLEATKKS